MNKNTGITIIPNSGKMPCPIQRGGTRKLIKYSAGICDKICSLLSEGKSLSSILRFKTMPSRNTFYDWCEEYPDLKQKYLIARARKAHALVEQALDAPQQALDKVDTMDIADKRCNAVVQAYRLKADTNLKVAGLYNKKDYGDSKDATVPTAIGVQVVFGECQPIREVQAEVTDAAAKHE